MALAVVVCPPDKNRTIAFKRDTEKLAGSNFDDAAEAGRHVALAIHVIAPGENRAVGLQSEAVVHGERKGHEVGGSIWRQNLSAAPRNDAARGSRKESSLGKGKNCNDGNKCY